MHRTLITNEVIFCRPHNLGWLRRPELDLDDTEAIWEKPDGSLIAYPKSAGEPCIAILKKPLKDILDAIKDSPG